MAPNQLMGPLLKLFEIIGLQPKHEVNIHYEAEDREFPEGTVRRSYVLPSKTFGRRFNESYMHNLYLGYDSLIKNREGLKKVVIKVDSVYGQSTFEKDLKELERKLTYVSMDLQKFSDRHYENIQNGSPEHELLIKKLQNYEIALKGVKLLMDNNKVMANFNKFE